MTDELLAKTIAYEYDQNGNRARMLGPGGEETVYRYDTRSRIKEIVDPDGGRTVFRHDRAGRRAAMVFPNGVTGVYLYDPASRLESIVYKNTSGDVLQSFAYTHDNVGNRLSKTFASGESESYGCDDLHRLASVSYPSGRSVAYQYDPVGNRQFVTESWNGGPPEATTYNYSDFNQVLSTTDSQGTTGYAWDDNGNLVGIQKPSGEITRYNYNFENRLIGILYPGGAANAFGYDPQGIRVFKEDSEGRHNYLIDQVSVLAEFNGAGVKKAWYNANPQRIDEIISQVQAAGKFYHLVDGLGSVYGLVNQSQVKVAAYSFDAYGALTDQQVQPGIVNPYLFTGRELDADSGWQYNRARYYLSGVGSWNREDPFNLKKQMALEGSARTGCRSTRTGYASAGDSPDDSREQEHVNGAESDKETPLSFLTRVMTCIIISLEVRNGKNRGGNEASRQQSATASCPTEARGTSPVPRNFPGGVCPAHRRVAPYRGQVGKRDSESDSRDAGADGFLAETDQKTR